MRILHISTFSPTRCGIATYTESLIQNLHDAKHATIRLAYHCDETSVGADFEIKIEDRRTYKQIVQTINQSDADVVSLQHEFAIFGGVDGEYVLDLLSGITKPIVTTLHTTPELPSGEQRAILSALYAHSRALVVLTEQARANIAAILGTDIKLVVIRHGVPDVSFMLPAASALRRRWRKEHVFLSAGHISDRKGYTNTLAAMRELRKITTNFLYIIIGTYQPQFGSNAHSANSVRRMIIEYELEENVLLLESYVELELMINHILASDVGIVAYTDCQQSSSGMIPLLLGCGRPVVATPFEYAHHTSLSIPGLYVSASYQAGDILSVLLKIIEEKQTVVSSMPDIYTATRAWIWPVVARMYMKLFSNLPSRV